MISILVTDTLALSMQVELEATTEDSGTALCAPTTEAGFVPACKDTCFGTLKLRIWERNYDGSNGKVQHSNFFVSICYPYSVFHANVIHKAC